MGLKDYLKCVYTNKITLGSLVLFGLGAASMTLGIELENIPYANDLTALGIMGLASGFTGILGTAGGAATYGSYRKLKTKIERGGEVTQNGYSGPYCGYSGQVLAVREAGLEHLLPNSFLDREFD